MKERKVYVFIAMFGLCFLNNLFTSHHNHIHLEHLEEYESHILAQEFAVELENAFREEELCEEELDES